MEAKNRVKPLTQIYSNYTDEDFAVWETLYNRQLSTLSKHGCSDYLKALHAVGFHADAIPDFERTNARLASQTGWQIKTVECLCPPEQFFAYLANKTFTATCWLRTMSELDYIEEPDMFHDVFGHVPLLTNQEYCDFFQQLGTLAVKYSTNPEALIQIERLYWFTIEFGLTEEEEALKVYGAGIMSSKGELANALSDASTKHPFNVEKIMNHSFRNDVIQNEYYVIKDYHQLKNCIPEVESVLSKL
jgi:phenylalanine-4-hydroxylase